MQSIDMSNTQCSHPSSWQLRTERPADGGLSCSWARLSGGSCWLPEGRWGSGRTLRGLLKMFHWGVYAWRDVDDLRDCFGLLETTSWAWRSWALERFKRKIASGWCCSCHTYTMWRCSLPIIPWKGKRSSLIDIKFQDGDQYSLDGVHRYWWFWNEGSYGTRSCALQ